MSVFGRDMAVKKVFSLESVLKLEHWRGSGLLSLLQHALQQRLRPRRRRRGVGPGVAAAASAGRWGPVPLPLEQVASLAEALHLHAGDLRFASSVFDWFFKLKLLSSVKLFKFKLGMLIMEILETFNKCRQRRRLLSWLSFIASCLSFSLIEHSSSSTLLCSIPTWKVTHRLDEI